MLLKAGGRRDDEINRKKLPIQLQGASYYPIKSDVIDFLVIFDYYCSNVACSVFAVKQDKVIHELNSYGFPQNIRSSPKAVKFEIVDLNERDEKQSFAITINADELIQIAIPKKPTILWRRDMIQ